MRNKLMWLGTSIVLLVICGCDNQSPDARIVDGLYVGLIYKVCTLPPKLDAWKLSTETGENICGATFGIHTQCKAGLDGEITPAGVRIECHVLQHFDILYPDCDWWDKSSPGGTQYGYIRSFPDGEWDEDGGDNELGIAKGRTDTDGCVDFFIGLGDPNTGFDTVYNPEYEWPSGDTIIDTFVELKFKLPRSSGDIEQNAWVHFVRAPYQNFWKPSGGVYGSSNSGIGNSSMTLMSMEVGGTDVNDLNDVNEINIPMMLFEPKKWPSKDAERNPVVSKTLSTADISIPEPNDPDGMWKFKGSSWSQYVYSSGWWHWVDAYGIIPADLNTTNPNQVASFFDYSEPHCFDYSVMIDQASYPHYSGWSFKGSTVEIRSVDSSGNIVSTMPTWSYWYYLNSVYEDNKSWFWFDLEAGNIVSISNKEAEGYYLDSNGKTYTAIYVPINGHLEGRPYISNGDFNFDGITNFEDYSLLLSMDGVTHQNSNYDFMYDATMDGIINWEDHRYFFNSWLHEHFIPGDWNADYVVDFRDFANCFKFPPEEVHSNLQTVHENWLRGTK